MELAVLKTQIENIISNVLQKADEAECFYTEIHSSSFSIKKK